MRQIPGLNDLRVFEAAARLQNFRQAAEELHLTHGAVSHRIRALEDQLSVCLFERQNGVRLTEAGRELQVAVSSALQQLGAAVDRIGQHYAHSKNVIRLSVFASFANRWLLPRLPDFYRNHADIALQIEASVDLVQLGPNGVDATVRFGGGSWKGVRAEKLMDERNYPVASPEFIRQYQPQTLNDLLRLPLIYHAGSLGGSASWSRFFQALKLPVKAPLITTTFDDGNLVLQAAEQGLGIAFARHNLVANAIKEGRLMRLFDCGLRGSFAYYFVTALDHCELKNIEILRQWLQAQARSFEHESAAQLAGVRWLD